MSLTKEEIKAIAKREFVTVGTVQRWIRRYGEEYAKNKKAESTSVIARKAKNKSPWRNFVINHEKY